MVAVFEETPSGFVIIDYFGARQFDGASMHDSINQRIRLGIPNQRVLIRVDRYTTIGNTTLTDEDINRSLALTKCQALVCENEKLLEVLRKLSKRLREQVPVEFFTNEQEARQWLGKFE